MNKNIYKEIYLKNFTKSKMKAKMILILIIISLFQIFAFSFKNTMDAFINTGIKEDIWYRSIFVNTNETITSESDTINILENLKYVDNVVLDTEFYTTVNLKHNDFEGDFWLIGSNEQTRPEVTYGNDIKNNHEIICPNNFYPDDNMDNSSHLTREDFIDTTKLIDTSIKISFNQYKNEDLIDKNIISEDLKIVGTFENNPNYQDENKCYCSNSLIKDINEETFKYMDLSNQSNSIVVQVNNSDNVDSVIKSITNLGYLTSRMMHVNSDMLYLVNCVVYIILIISLFFSFFMINSIMLKNIDNSMKKFNILRTLGYKKKQLIKLNFFENNILGLIISILLIIIILIICGLCNIAIYYRPYLFYKIPITLSINSIIFSIIIIFLTLNLSSVKINKKLLKSTIMETFRDKYE